MRTLCPFCDSPTTARTKQPTLLPTKTQIYIPTKTMPNQVPSQELTSRPTLQSLSTTKGNGAVVSGTEAQTSTTTKVTEWLYFAVDTGRDSVGLWTSCTWPSSKRCLQMLFVADADLGGNEFNFQRRLARLTLCSLRTTDLSDIALRSNGADQGTSHLTGRLKQRMENLERLFAMCCSCLRTSRPQREKMAR